MGLLSGNVNWCLLLPPKGLLYASAYEHDAYIYPTAYLGPTSKSQARGRAVGGRAPAKERCQGGTRRRALQSGPNTSTDDSIAVLAALGSGRSRGAL